MTAPVAAAHQGLNPHTLSRCGEVTEELLREVFAQLPSQGVTLEGMLLKANLVLAGSSCPEQGSTHTVADVTVCCSGRADPAAVAGPAFLSGGQSGDLASSRLNAINNPDRLPLPWPVPFSFGRDIQQAALTSWAGQAANVDRAQHALIQRSKSHPEARRGDYTLSGSTAHAPHLEQAKAS